ncbi:MAG: glycosyltransferase family 2 protein [Flavihumibacter sp.]|nr:glycosyltransferase family 2 protein [Flavihumibacter sp.]
MHNTATTITGISVVIPNYNGIGLFEHTLPTVVAALATINLPSEIIVADDCSTDDSVNYLRTHYPAIKVIVQKVNAGFSVTSNAGIKAAIHSHVLLLNSDVKLTPGYFTDQLRYFEAPDTFGVMGRIEGWEDTIIQDGAKYPSFHGVKIKTTGNYLLKDKELMKDGLYTMYLSGANMLVDKQKFLAIGGFNELFAPFYSEDYELSVRAWRLGYTCYFNYNSLCLHKTSATIKTHRQKNKVKAIYYRNKFYVHALHLQGIKKILWYIQWLPETFFQILIGRWYLWQSLKMFLANRSGIKQSVAAFNKLARQSPAHYSLQQVAQRIKSSIQHPAHFF